MNLLANFLLSSTAIFTTFCISWMVVTVLIPHSTTSEYRNLSTILQRRDDDCSAGPQSKINSPQNNTPVHDHPTISVEVGLKGQTSIQNLNIFLVSTVLDPPVNLTLSNGFDFSNRSGTVLNLGGVQLPRCALPGSYNLVFNEISQIKSSTCFFSILIPVFVDQTESSPITTCSTNAFSQIASPEESSSLESTQVSVVPTMNTFTLSSTPALSTSSMKSNFNPASASATSVPAPSTSSRSSDLDPDTALFFPISKSPRSTLLKPILSSLLVGFGGAFLEIVLNGIL